MYTYFTKRERTILRYMISRHKWALMNKQVETDEEAQKQLKRLREYDTMLKKLDKSDGRK